MTYHPILLLMVTLFVIVVTDINSALLEGAKMLNQNPRDGSASILIPLTDGDPTTGKTQLDLTTSKTLPLVRHSYVDLTTSKTLPLVRHS